MLLPLKVLQREEGVESTPPHHRFSVRYGAEIPKASEKRRGGKGGKGIRV